MADKQGYVTLSDGRKMPLLGLGTWESPPDKVYDAVKTAIKNGYRHIDTALAYQNEPEIGKAINDLIAEGVIKREDLWVTTKLWQAYHSKENAPRGLELSLQKLGLEYIDLYLIHFPIGFKENSDNLFPVDADGNVISTDVDYVETWGMMEQFQKEGKVKSIGVSNFSPQQLERLAKECSVAPAVNQVLCNPFYIQAPLKEYCDKHNIHISAYSPLGKPGKQAAEDSLLHRPPVVAVAKKHNKTPAQVLIRFALDRGMSVLPKSITPTRIAENMDVWDFSLTEEEIGHICSLDGSKEREWGKFSALRSHQYWPFNDGLQ